MDRRAYAAPKGLRPRRQVKPGDDSLFQYRISRQIRPA